MSYTIQRLSDHHDCETCGYSAADGYQIYKDSILIINNQPVASCFDSVNYDYVQAYYDIFNLEKIDVQQDEPYYCVEEEE